jgi:hypothetical protein
MALSPDENLRGHFHGTSACLSALYRAERYTEIVDILQVDTIWPYKRWAVKALAALGKKAEAIRYAESCRGPWTPDGDVDALCEEILLSSGLIEEAYARYGVRVSRGGTYLATFRAVAKQSLPTQGNIEKPLAALPIPERRSCLRPRRSNPARNHSDTAADEVSNRDRCSRLYSGR